MIGVDITGTLRYGHCHSENVFDCDHRWSAWTGIYGWKVDTNVSVLKCFNPTPSPTSLPSNNPSMYPTKNPSIHPSFPPTKMMQSSTVVPLFVNQTVTDSVDSGNGQKTNQLQQSFTCMSCLN